MASPTLGPAATVNTMLYKVRHYSLDSSSVAQAQTDAQLTQLINAMLRWWYETEPRNQEVTLAASYADSAMSVTTDAAANYPEIHNVFIVSAGGRVGATSGAPVTNRRVMLEELGWDQLASLQRRIAGVDNPGMGTITDLNGGVWPKYYALQKVAGSTGRWQLALCDATQMAQSAVAVKAMARVYPVALSVDADVIDAGDFEADCIARLAAADALLNNRLPEELLGGLLAPLPKMIRDKYLAERRRPPADTPSRTARSAA